MSHSVAVAGPLAGYTVERPVTESITTLLASAMILGLLACFFPAWNASRLSIIEALRVSD